LNPEKQKVKKSAQSDPATETEQSRPLRSSDIMGTQREVWIEHGGQLYRLRITSNDKLILTK
jgi:hemin uptake protein HemP